MATESENSTTSTTTTTKSKSKVITIGIAGGTGAGKSTLAKKLYEQLGGEKNVSYLVHDSYYKDLTHLCVAERNFDHPQSLETSLLIYHIQQLKLGNTIHVPIYDFTTHTRKVPIDMYCTIVQSKPIIIIEGILLFCHKELTNEMDIKVYVDADADVRLSRRIQRDIVERGRTVDDVIEQYNATVRPMHTLYVEPSKKEADIIVHSTKHSMDTSIDLLVTYLSAKSGIILQQQTPQEQQQLSSTETATTSSEVKETDNYDNKQPLF